MVATASRWKMTLILHEGSPGLTHRPDPPPPPEEIVLIWLRENKDMPTEDRILDFDDYMNLVEDDTDEIMVKKETQRAARRILLKSLIHTRKKLAIKLCRYCERYISYTGLHSTDVGLL